MPEYCCTSWKSLRTVYFISICVLWYLSLVLPTDLTVASQESGAGAVADVAVPALLALSSVGAGGAAAPLLELARAEAADARRALDLSQTPHISTLAVDEEVADAAHVAVVEQRGPDLGRQDQALTALRQTAQIHVTVQVQDLAALVRAEGNGAAVDGDGACREDGGEACMSDVCLHERVFQRELCSLGTSQRFMTYS